MEWQDIIYCYKERTIVIFSLFITVTHRTLSTVNNVNLDLSLTNKNDISGSDQVCPYSTLIFEFSRAFTEI